MVNEKLDNEKKLNQETEKTEILPEKKLSFNEDGSVTFPEVTLSNPVESLKYAREQEKIIISKLRESNEYVINEVKEMLESAFKSYFTHIYDREAYEDICRKNNWEMVPVDDDRIKKQKYNYIDAPLQFLTEYEGSLSNFINLFAQNMQIRPGYTLWERFGISQKELLAMDTISVFEKIKNDINNISLLKPFEKSHGKYKQDLGQMYCSCILGILRENFGYKEHRKY